MHMSDALRRAARTFIQSFIGVFLSLLVTPNVLPGVVPGTDALKSAALAGVWSGVVAVLSWLQNALEDNTSFPAVMKAPPSSGVNPVPDPDISPH